MELWIRSQDKVMLTQVSLLHIDRDEEDGRYLFFDTDLLLGIYKTKERALEVLDGIQNMLHNVQLGYEQMTIYEMPQE